MNEPIVLTEDELFEITRLVRPSAQQKWLAATYGIHADRRSDGSLSVPRALYYQRVGIKIERQPEVRF